MTARREITIGIDELEQLLERAVETGVERAIAKLKPAPVPMRRRGRRDLPKPSPEAHEEIARMNLRKGIRRRA